MTLDISQQAAVNQISSLTTRAKHKDVSQDRLHFLFIYQDGFLFRRVPAGRWNRLPAGSLFGGVNRYGYREGRVDGVLYPIHRLIWMYHYGYFPENDIDHINRNRLDNRIENLREVSRQCNLRNIGLAINNTSKVKGIGFCKSRGQWRSYVKLNQRNIYLGRFSDFIEAVAHRLAIEQCLGWHGCDSTSPALTEMKKFLEQNRS
jgi:hypothetical protein